MHAFLTAYNENLTRGKNYFTTPVFTFFFVWHFLCRLISIVAHRHQFVMCLSVCPVVTKFGSHTSLCFAGDTMHSLKCCYSGFDTPVFKRDVQCIMVWRCLSFRLSVRVSISFPHFSPTCFDILSWNFAYDFVLMTYKSSLSAVTLC